MATNKMIEAMKTGLQASFDPVKLTHRDFIKEAIAERMKSPLTVKDIEPYVEPHLRNVISDDQAMGLLFVCGVGEVLAVETGRWDDDALHEIWHLARQINTPEMEPGTLMDLILERLPGSITYKALH